MTLAKIDTNMWKEFKLTKIFRMRNTKCIVQKDIVPDSGLTPYVTAQSGNNGVMTYIDCPEEWLDEGNCIMIGGKTLTFSYQSQSFCSNDSHNIALYLKDEDSASEMRYLFLITALRRSLYQKYSWGDSISMKSIVDDTFYIPVNSSDEPDWEYMDEFMFKVMQESATNLESLAQADGEKHALDISGWKKFHLYDDALFDIDMGTKLDRVKMLQSNPDVNFVGRANANNGITARVDSIAGIEPYSAGNMTLSLGGEYLGSCFVQPDKFYTSQNVIVLKPKHEMSFSVKQFIATMIFRESRSYYKAFIDELNRHIKTDFSFYLPVDSMGKPDWAYMEAYMCSMIHGAETDLDAMQSALQ
ncbi:putative S-CspCI [Eubacterium callanderi]|uniref:S-CspCI n=1 Tax=Eubacterium callanderi TaxID=53442 RepID=E3GPA7_9FIRM|nr:putative S-CspCI [Eubacterium callanderi]OEZ06377.1 restriction enzyme BgcI subunit beta [[Butyribacterium] methylotrophicum]WPK82701.1 Restriction enzyme BgcI subunit beta [Eubacterium callanderi]